MKSDRNMKQNENSLDEKRNINSTTPSNTGVIQRPTNDSQIRNKNNTGRDNSFRNNETPQNNQVPKINDDRTNNRNNTNPKPDFTRPQNNEYSRPNFDKQERNMNNSREMEKPDRNLIDNSNFERLNKQEENMERKKASEYSVPQRNENKTPVFQPRNEPKQFKIETPAPSPAPRNAEPSRPSEQKSNNSGGRRR
jgi:hypothetical protein